MAAATHTLSLPGGMLQRGFWLYVWEVETAGGRMLYYVGRTGDSSSPFASNPYRRMGQHLGSQPNQTALRNHLEAAEVDIDACRFRFVCHGPIYPEAVGENHALRMQAHEPVRNRMSAMEKALAVELKDAGYSVLNTVGSNQSFDPTVWAEVRQAFLAEFPGLAVVSATPST